MKNFVLIICALLFLSAGAQPLKGGVVEEYIPSGFFGSWGVISKLDSSNNPDAFNFESRDVWTLSGYNNILILENLQSGAHSEIEIKDKNRDGKTLKFEREKSIVKNGIKTVYKETVSFKLMGSQFSGTDEFIVERYDSNNKLTGTDRAIYRIAGVRISGDNP